jgi:hypothetical protein
MNYLVWLLRRGIARIGWAGVAGLVLLLFGIGFSLTAIQNERAQLARAEGRAASLHTRIREAARGGITLTGAEAQLADFYSFFGIRDTTIWLDKIYAIAAKHNLTLDQGEYRVTPDKTGKLIRYEVTLPLKGSYVQLREFLDDVLTEVPVAALDDVGFKRESIGTTTLEARVKLTLFLGAA